MSAELFTVASPGRSGTKWYSEIFRSEQSYCFHELTTWTHRYPVNIAVVDRLARVTKHDLAESTARRMVLEGFPDYFERLWARATDDVRLVGNSDHLATPLLSGLHLVWPRMRFLFSFRNGIQQVDSMFRWQDHAETALLASWRSRYGAGDYFELCCKDWAGVVADLQHHRDFLCKRRADVLETRFERVLTKEREFKRVWKWLFGRWDNEGRAARALTGTVINARSGTEPPPSANDIWSGWTPEQRELFTTICGQTQGRLGYSTPRRA